MKGSYTVEACLLGALLCLLLCFMITLTLALYRRVEEYGNRCVEEVQEATAASEWIRAERFAGDFIFE